MLCTVDHFAAGWHQVHLVVRDVGMVVRLVEIVHLDMGVVPLVGMDIPLVEILMALRPLALVRMLAVHSLAVLVVAFASMDLDYHCSYQLVVMAGHGA